MYTVAHREYRLLDGSAFFDRSWYLRKYEDVRQDYDPIIDYLNHGAAEGRDPGPLFSTKSYLARRPEVAKLNVNPLVHFLDHGLFEADQTAPAVQNLPEGASEYEIVRASGWFDEEWYLNHYPDIKQSGVD